MQAPENDHPHADGTGVGLMRFCHWLRDQGLVSNKNAHQMRLAVHQVLGVHDAWPTLNIRRRDLDALLARFIGSAGSLRPASVKTYTTSARKAVRWYLAHLDDPSGFLRARVARNQTRPWPAAAPDPQLNAASSHEILVDPFPLRPSHVVWLRLPADRLVAFIETLAVDGHAPSAAGTAPVPG